MSFRLSTAAVLCVAVFLLSIDINQARRECLGNETFACGDGRCIPRSWRCDGDIDCRHEEDEKDCHVTCGDGEFKCSSEQQQGPQFKPNHHPCIPQKWVCDGEFDCDDRSDEKNCGDVKCNADQFTCNEFDGQYKLCIPKTWKCDGQKDCASGVDEADCEKKECEVTDFPCANGVCIFKNWHCDGEDDCGDGSDERNCSRTAEQTCQDKHMFKCEHSEGCIPQDWKCDGEADCLDHSDEKNCKHNNHQCKRPATEFACASGTHCINKMWYCDGEEDCPDGSDEVDCKDAVKDTCLKDQYRCNNGRCIGMALRCDGREDCTDGGDEQACPAGNSTVTECDHLLEYQCARTPVECIRLDQVCKDSKQSCGDDDDCAKDILRCKPGSDYCDCHDSFIKGNKVCHCKEGFKPHGELCVDIDECEQLGACDQMCHNTVGGYSCSCHPGYKLSRGENKSVPNRCRAIGGDPLVLLSNRATIRQFDLVTNVHVPLIQSPGSAVAMDFHLTNGSLVWSDIAMQKILMCRIGGDTVNQHLAVKNNCDGDQSVLIETGVQTPDGLAIDWIHDLLFWTDGGLDEVNVLDLKTRKRRTLFHTDMEEPRAIAVDPEMGLIFWTDWGKEARIERAGMDGKHRTVIVKGPRVKWPNGLALDLVDKRVYWADAKVKSIFSCDYWGQGVMTVLHSHHFLRHPFSIAVFEDRVYYTDWEHDGVITVNKFTGGDVRKVMQKVTTPMTVRIYHKQAQPKLDNKCESSGCEDMCLPRAVYRGSAKSEEKEWHDRPFACLCQGDTPADLIECAVTIATDGASRGLSLTTLFFLLMLTVFTVTGVIFYRRRRSAGTFTALNFDNPIYRRTVEADMEDPFRDPFRDAEDGPAPRLVLAGSPQDPEVDIHNSQVEPMDRPFASA